MKKSKVFLLLFSSIILFNCSQNPKCNSDNVKEIALQELKEKLKENLQTEYYSNHIALDSAASPAYETPELDQSSNISNNIEDEKFNIYTEKLLKK